MSQADWSPVGLVGRLTVATRGHDGPGEVEVPIRGGNESFIATSSEPLAKGQRVLCLATDGARRVLVEAWGERVDSALRL